QMRQPKIIVVGGGLAGLMATIRVAEAGIPVDLFSIVPVKRSHSVCAQGGINAAKNQKGEGDTVDKHFDDTIYGGDFLANQPLVKRMCEAAPGIIDLLDRMGVMFNRTPEGLLDYRRFGGTLYHRTAFAGATTGQQLVYALDAQVRRPEFAGKGAVCGCRATPRRSALREAFLMANVFTSWKSGIRSTGIWSRVISPRARSTASCIKKNWASTDSRLCT